MLNFFSPRPVGCSVPSLVPPAHMGHQVCRRVGHPHRNRSSKDQEDEDERVPLGEAGDVGSGLTRRVHSGLLAKTAAHSLLGRVRDQLHRQFLHPHHHGRNGGDQIPHPGGSRNGQHHGRLHVLAARGFLVRSLLGSAVWVG
ncbi:uncharacterized protein ACA1_294480 [Acanthamoeba castellanii str. Neff]|uniref:Uncharacterized protein n=1 Tax=Acanthamoeba castellanii (strain ATCC 30010 / Neff) TaxID=1257118 RepID=L8HJN7_ACACF|nr:uncharacterized protein ACA1_294480 [Acanthamoeba castellanii str. Neff]ELR25425.1 hypothetical protein ACA1_294480 [Acanthamoeba castellanii str. Neff]